MKQKCANPNCSKEFDRTIRNKLYCHPECYREANRTRSVTKYAAKKKAHKHKMEFYYKWSKY